MNKHVSPEQLGVPPLTPAERVEALMDAFVKYQQLNQATENLRTSLRDATLRTTKREVICDQRDDAVIAENRARIEVVAHVKILMGDGVLGRCVKMLEIETPPAVAGRS